MTKCFDVAKMVLDEATERFSPLWDIDQERLEIFESYCLGVDSVVEEFDAESLEIEVDEIMMNVSVRIGCPSVIIYSKHHLFYELVKRSVSIGFKNVNEDLIEISLVFPSLWKKV